jgi:hypothetical protein
MQHRADAELGATASCSDCTGPKGTPAVAAPAEVFCPISSSRVAWQRRAAGIDLGIKERHAQIAGNVVEQDAHCRLQLAPGVGGGSGNYSVAG